MRTFGAMLVVVLGVTTTPADEKLPAPTEQELKQSKENLKKILLAMHEVHDAENTIPFNFYDLKTKKQFLSWRVRLLPFLGAGEQELFTQFKLDEPWDSENNKKLIEKMPKLFAPIRVKAKPGETFYRGFAGPTTVFPPAGRVSHVGATDGMSNVVAVVEAGEAVIWTKPDDLEFDPKKPLPKLGGLFDGDFHAGLLDGSVQRVNAKKMDANEFKLMLERNNGKPRNKAKAFGK